MKKPQTIIAGILLIFLCVTGKSLNLKSKQRIFEATSIAVILSHPHFHLTSLLKLVLLRSECWILFLDSMYKRIIVGISCACTLLIFQVLPFN